MELAASILFFYFFGLGSLLMTYYIVKTVKELIQVSREQQRKRKTVKPVTERDSVKLHISEGLIEVSRLPDEHQDG